MTRKEGPFLFAHNQEYLLKNHKNPFTPGKTWCHLRVKRSGTHLKLRDKYEKPMILWYEMI